MNDISVKIPFDSTKERISAATKELVSEIYRSYLGRHPTKADASRFQQKINPDNKSINDQYFDGKKIGSLITTYILDIPRCISINSGAITGFGNVNGVMHTADASTAQAAIDLLAGWTYLSTLTPTSAIGPVLGSGQILFAGVYSVAAAGSIVGALTFDAQGDPNAVFVITTGGALTTAAGATVALINGAVACNVFWVAEGAISMAASTTMRGTLIAHNGAIDMGAGGVLEGRELSTA